MTRPARQLIAMGLVALTAGLLGALIGGRVLVRTASPPRLHQLVHHDLGSGLVDHSQKMTVAAMQMADMNVWAQRS